MSKSWGTRTGLALGALPIVWAGGVAAQTPPPPEGELLRFSPDRPATAILPFSDTICAAGGERTAGDIRIETVEVEPGLRSDRVVEVTAPLLGMAVDQATADATLRLAECVAAQGSDGLAVATLTPGSAAGLWRLEVRRAVIGDIQITGIEDRSQIAFIRRAFGDVRPGQALTRSALRRGLEVAGRYGFYGVRASVKADETGNSLLLLDVDSAPPAVFVSAQNASAESVGRWSGGASLIGDGLTPLYEHNVLGLFHDLGGNRQRGAQISSRVLLTSSGLEGGVDLAIFEQRPNEQPPFADTIGTTRLARVELRHPLGSSGNLLWSARGGLELVDQDTDLQSGPATIRDSLRTVFGGVRADYRDQARTAVATLTVRRGLESLGASRAGDALLSRPEAEPQATVVRAEFWGVAPFANGQVELRAKAQAAGEPLLAFEEFTYGGLTGGRDLDPGALYGDSGISVGAEYVGPTLLEASRLTIRPVAFVEAVEAWNEDTIGPDHASGVFAGAGIRATVAGKLNFDVIYASRIGDVEGVPERQSEPRLFVGFNAGFAF